MKQIILLIILFLLLVVGQTIEFNYLFSNDWFDAGF